MNRLTLVIATFFGIITHLHAQIDTNTVVYSWKLDEHFASHLRVTVDTALENFENHNPVFRETVSVSTLGNYGEASESNIFTDRHRNDEFLLINTFYPYMKRFNNTAYYNTRKPFTRIGYFRGGSSLNKMEELDAFHTQNPTRDFNFGLHFTTLAAIGQYQFQKVRNNSFAIFSSLIKPMYAFHVSFNLNKIIADENGGILHDRDVIDTTYSFTKNIPTLFGGTDNPPRHFPDVFTEIGNISLFTLQEISFRGHAANADSSLSAGRIRIFYPKLVYILYAERNKRLFEDKNPEVGYQAGLYPALHFSDSFTADSMVYWKIHNAIRLQFQGRRNNHYFVDYGYELMQYTLREFSNHPVDTLPKFITEPLQLPARAYYGQIYNAFISSSLNKSFANHVELNLFGQYFLSGYRKTDFTLSGDLRLYTGQSGNQSSLVLKVVNQLKTPDFLYTHYVSNNFMWTKSFRQTALNHLSANLSLPQEHLELQGDYFLFHNFVYFNTDAFPDQFLPALSVLSLSASKQVTFWRITSNTKVVYQKTDHQNILGLPELSVYNSTYLTQPVYFKSTGGRLLVLLGWDLFYNTRYYADGYMPSLTTFYRQTEQKLGNYPYADVFLNIQLKRLRFYLKMEHINSKWGDNNYFTVPHYPRNQRNLQFGLSWTFYD